MSVAIITGSAGLVGSETVKFLHEKGLHIVGIDNNMRQYFFGEESSTAWNTEQLKATLRNFTHVGVDIREQGRVFAIFQQFGKHITLKEHHATRACALRVPMQHCLACLPDLPTCRSRGLLQ